MFQFGSDAVDTARGVLALTVLTAGIVLTIAWIGLLGFVVYRGAAWLLA